MSIHYMCIGTVDEPGVACIVVMAINIQAIDADITANVARTPNVSAAARNRPSSSRGGLDRTADGVRSFVPPAATASCLPESPTWAAAARARSPSPGAARRRRTSDHSSISAQR